jgi:hypothetical protein
MTLDAIRTPIRFDAWYRLLSTAVFLLPSQAFVEHDRNAVTVRMGWGFRARFPRSCIASASVSESRPISRGVHGFGGRWLVNGSADRILALELQPAQRAWVMGFPVALRQLLVSVDAPELLARQLKA